ncbi:hypothetical protein [uncultured Draconibacterium sp.]|uniref:hypothetical protein n=1 Tax=uncultured Draconibacterium sp. TaxID=1573823 RepID=UPI0029C6D166|nr:hypothetical protein [uncultured Draconibacterium sp.]
MKRKKTVTPITGVIFEALMGTIGLVLFTAGSFWVTETAAAAIKNWGTPEWVVYLGGGLVSCSLFLIIILLFSFAIKRPIADIIKLSAYDLNVAVKRMKYVFYGEGQPYKNENPLTGILTDAEHILNEKKNEKNIDKIVLGGKYEELQSKFIEKSGLEKTENVDLYIAGTMLGTFCDDSTGLASQMVSLSIKNQNPPFNNAYFCAPGHICKGDVCLNSKGPHQRALYPFSARISAGDTLLQLCKNWKNNHFPLQRNLGIFLSFVPQRDIFPAIQLWGQKAAMILCSTGTVDRKSEYSNGRFNTAITKAMPVALMLTNKEYRLHCSNPEENKTPFKLDDTLMRLQHHIRWDYHIEKNEKLEEWSLHAFNTEIEPRFSVKHYSSLEEEQEFLNLIDCSTRYNKKVLDMVKKYLKRLSTSDENPMNLKEFEKIITKIKEITYTLSGESSSIQ